MQICTNSRNLRIPLCRHLWKGGKLMNGSQPRDLIGWPGLAALSLTALSFVSLLFVALLFVAPLTFALPLYFRHFGFCHQEGLPHWTHGLQASWWNHLDQESGFSPLAGEPKFCTQFTTRQSEDMLDEQTPSLESATCTTGQALWRQYLRISALAIPANERNHIDTRNTVFFCPSRYQNSIGRIF